VATRSSRAPILARAGAHGAAQASFAGYLALGSKRVAPSDLDLRQVPRAPERRGHEVQSRPNLGPGRRP
jgi:2-keto-4-pentenoate hydratase